MLNVVKNKVQDLVHVLKNILEIRMLNVDLNAFLIQIVPKIVHVSEINVAILVQVYVELMQNVMW